MSKIHRFSISIEKDLLDKFDRLIRKKNYANRSDAFRDLIRQELVKRQWQQNISDIAGAIILLYNHQKRELMKKLAHIQHHFQKIIISTQHIHLDHSNCLEIIVVKGRPYQAHKLASSLKSVKGVKHTSLSISSTGKDLE